MNLTEIIDELCTYGMAKEDACRLVAQLIGIGAKAAAFRIKTLDDVHKLRQGGELSGAVTLKFVAKDEGHKNAD
jgi:hypothetical protein